MMARKVLLVVCLSIFLGACSVSTLVVLTQENAALPTKPVSSSATPEELANNLTYEQIASLESLEKLDNYPLYRMDFFGSYRLDVADSVDPLIFGQSEGTPSWACSLFAAFIDRGNYLYGRNFDWQFSPTLILFTDPPDGYASVSMVDIAYLGYDGSRGRQIMDLPFSERTDLLEAPILPFDGMNEYGLVVGMAAVPATEQTINPDLETIDSLMVIRLMLDRARNVDEALDIFRQYNLDWGRGPALHYLVADQNGDSILIEYWGGKVNVIESHTNWQAATNFLQASFPEELTGVCARYDSIYEQMEAAQGNFSPEDAMQVLTSVAQSNTQWSVVYGLSDGEIKVVMGQNYELVHDLYLEMAKDE